MDNQDPQLQSETGRPIDNFLVNSSSPLFYTVSGSQSENRFGSKYYYEQLGCPSIIKPSFRDLPGCTRMSVGVPSTPYRQFPLDRLNKTIMGKSPTTATNPLGKRYNPNRGERYISPIKVNAKIRHIYSHITSSDSVAVSESSINSTSAQTQTDFDPSDPDQKEIDVTTIEEEVNTAVSKSKDASTCMSPPHTPQPSSDQLFTVPPSYAGKLEDLEKITGHIVIQRFFTRADEAFGLWLEKQLGMNSKSVGVGNGIDDQSANDENSFTKSVHEDFEDAKRIRESRILEKIVEVDDIFPCGEVVEIRENECICSVNDFVKCECFLNSFKIIQETSTELENVNKLSSIEQQLVGHCIQYEILDQVDMAEDVGQENIETEVRLSITNNHQNNEIEEDQDSTTLFGDPNSNLPRESEDKLNSFKQNEAELQPPKIDNMDLDDIPGRQCIPDVIDVSSLNKSKLPVPTEPSDNESITTTSNTDQLESTVISIPENELVPQNKVEEYLVKLEITSTSSPIPLQTSTSVNSLNSLPLDETEVPGESLMPTQKVYSSYEVDEALIKRSISADSCVGTESSGERNVLNDSGIQLDSGRLDIPEESDVSISTTSANKVEEKVQEISDNVTKDVVEEPRLEGKSGTPVWEKQDSQEQEVTLLSNKSIDESTHTNYSRSDQSSGINKQTSDEEGEDADQSESNSESELNSLRKLSIKSVEIYKEGDCEGSLVDEDDDVKEDIETDQDEPDQFDTIIENHEKEKRLRPICRKRNACTQTSKSLESSTITSCSASSRSTTATSESSFDLEFVSKSRKYISHIPSKPGVGHANMQQSKRRSFLPNGSSGLNVLNMKFTMGKEFESEVSIRIPPKSPTASVSSSHSQHNQNPSSSKIHSYAQTLPNIGAIAGVTPTPILGPRRGKFVPSQQHQQHILQPMKGVHDHELKNLWKDVKLKMDSKVGDGESGVSVGETELEVRGSRVKLISSEELPATRQSGCSSGPDANLNPTEESTRLPVLISTSEEERIKRSLKRLKKILDD